MTDLARTVADELLHRHPERRIDLALNDLPPAWGDPAMVKQVVVNLLSNAIKFTAPRGDAARIEIGGKRNGDMCQYSVRDNGVGFDMRFADKLFGVFQRLHSPKEFEGTGVGLAIVHRVITRHGGTVTADSDPQRGTTFTFTLPARSIS
jgi:signal transduction histidine kinase